MFVRVSAGYIFASHYRVSTEQSARTDSSLWDGPLNQVTLVNDQLGAQFLYL